MTVTLCTAWSIHWQSPVLLAHTQSAVLPSQLVDNQSCHQSFSVPSWLLVSHAVDHSTGNSLCSSSSRQSYCCRESYSHPGRLLADRGLKQRLDISKIVLLYINLLRLGKQEFNEDCYIGKSTPCFGELSFFNSFKAHCIVVCPIVTGTIYTISFKTTVTAAVE